MKNTLYSIILLSIINIHSTSYAYNTKLEFLQTKVNIIFSPELSNSAKTKGIQNLFALIKKNPASLEYFGFDKIINQVIIFDSALYDYKHISELYGNTIYFEYSGRNASILNDSFENFKDELSSITLLETSLKQVFPQITITRITGYLSDLPTSNSSYLENLKSFFTVSTSNTFINSLLKFETIFLNDSSFSLYPTQIEILHDHTEERTLDITFGRKNSPMGLNYIDELTISQMLDIVLNKNFQSIKNYALIEEDIISAIHELSSFLTDDVTSLLHKNNVLHFMFTYNYTNIENHFSNKTLFLGTTKETMTKILEKTFSQN